MAITETVYNRIITKLKQLPDDKIIEVDNFVSFLYSKHSNSNRFSRFAGGISHEDAEIMRNAIEEDCERIINE